MKNNCAASKPSLDTINEIFPYARERAYSKKTVLFNHGQVINHILIIKSGWVKVSTETIDGKEAVVDMLTSGSLLGENALLNSQEQSFSAEVVSKEATFMEVPISSIRESMNKNHNACFYFLSNLILHVHSLRTRVEYLSSATAIQKISCFLLSFHQNEGDSFVLPCSKTQIATYLGVERETMSRAIKKLKKDGIIKIEDEHITILNKERLTEYNPTANESGKPFDGCYDSLVQAANQLMIDNRNWGL